VAVEAPAGGYALIDTRLQEEAFRAALEAGLVPRLRGCRVAARSPRVGGSVLDYLLECRGRRVYLELKSAAFLSWSGEALYPDCPTERGRRHLRLLARLAARGEAAAIYFVTAVPGARVVRPNRLADPQVADALLEALEAGVEAGAVGLEYLPGLNAVRVYAETLPVVPA
jgi:sugar fermentation stimulation protein A